MQVASPLGAPAMPNLVSGSNREIKYLVKAICVCQIIPSVEVSVSYNTYEMLTSILGEDASPVCKADSGVTGYGNLGLGGSSRVRTGEGPLKPGSRYHVEAHEGDVLPECGA